MRVGVHNFFHRIYGVSSISTDGFHSIHSQEMASKAVTHERWNPQHVLTTYGVYKIYTRYFSSIFVFPLTSSLVHNFTKDSRNPQHLRDTESTALTHKIMEHTAFSHVRCNTLYIIMRHWFRSIYFWEMEYARILYEWWNPQHLPIIDRDSNIFTTQVVYIAFIHASWRPQHLSLRYGVHSIYSWEMASTAICHDWCSPNRLISRDGFHIFYWRHMEYTLFTLEKGVHSIFTWYMQLLLSYFSL